MMSIAVISSLIGTEDACLPVGREDRRTKTPIIKYVSLIFLSPQPTIKVADNHKII